VINKMNGRFHGCNAWIIAVRIAKKMPVGVRDLREIARTTRRVVAKKAKMRFMLLRCSICCAARENFGGGFWVW